MAKTRQHYKADYKAKVALEALKEQQTISELAGNYKLHPNQISEWKRVVKDEAHLLFTKSSGLASKSEAALIDRLYMEIGQLQAELSWLKKKV